MFDMTPRVDPQFSRVALTFPPSGPFVVNINTRKKKHTYLCAITGALPGLQPSIGHRGAVLGAHAPLAGGGSAGDVKKITGYRK